MKREHCSGCIALVVGNNNEEWYCDECQKTVEEVETCPEATS